MSKRPRADMSATRAPHLLPGLVLLHRLSKATTRIFSDNFACADLPHRPDTRLELLQRSLGTTLVVCEAQTRDDLASSLGVPLCTLSELVDTRGLRVITVGCVSQFLESLRRGVTAGVALDAMKLDGILTTAPAPPARRRDADGGGSFGAVDLGTPSVLQRQPPAPMPPLPSPWQEGDFTPLLPRVRWHPAAAASAAKETLATAATSTALPLPSAPPCPHTAGLELPPSPCAADAVPPRALASPGVHATAAAGGVSKPPALSSAIDVLWGGPESINTPLPSDFFSGREPPQNGGAWLVVIWRGLRRALVWHGWNTVVWYECNHDGPLPSAATLCKPAGAGGQRLSRELVNAEWVRSAQDCEAPECDCAQRGDGSEAARCPTCRGCCCGARHQSPEGVSTPKRWRNVYEAKQRHFWPMFKQDASELLRAARKLAALGKSERGDPLIKLLRAWYEEGDTLRPRRAVKGHA